MPCVRLRPAECRVSVAAEPNAALAFAGAQTPDASRARTGVTPLALKDLT
jgi:hypothetical protein